MCAGEDAHAPKCLSARLIADNEPYQQFPTQERAHDTIFPAPRARGRNARIPPREGNENRVRNFIALLGEQASPPALMEERYFPSSRARTPALPGHPTPQYVPEHFPAPERTECHELGFPMPLSTTRSAERHLFPPGKFVGVMVYLLSSSRRRYTSAFCSSVKPLLSFAKCRSFMT